MERVLVIMRPRHTEVVNVDQLNLIYVSTAPAILTIIHHPLVSSLPTDLIRHTNAPEVLPRLLDLQLKIIILNSTLKMAIWMRDSTAYLRDCVIIDHQGYRPPDAHPYGKASPHATIIRY